MSGARSGKAVRRTVAGEEHALVVLLITGRDPHGRPRECRMLHDDEKIEVADGMEFITAYVPAITVRRSAS